MDNSHSATTSGNPAAPAWLPPDDWARFSTHTRRTSFPPRTAIIVEGQQPAGLFVIVEGFARVERQSGGGGVALARLGPGEAFGEMSLLEETPASASVVAEDTVTVDLIPRDDLLALLATDVGLAVSFYRSLAVNLSVRLRNTSAHLARMTVADGPSSAPRRSSTAMRISDSQLPPDLVTAVADFQERIQTVQEVTEGRTSPGDPQRIVNDACNAICAALARQLDQETVIVEAGYEEPRPFQRPSGEARALGSYVSREIYPLLMASATLGRGRDKPPGFLHEATLVERIYEAAPKGQGALGAYFDAWFLSRPFCVARREARSRMTALIEETRRDAPANRPVDILALTCPSPRELLDALADGGAGVRATCLDGDQRALRQGAEMAARALLTHAITFVQANVARLAEGYGAVALAPQRFMFGIGLCDSLDDDALAAVLNWAYDRLEPGGTLVVSGLLPRHPDQLLLQYVLEWHAYLRSARQLGEVFLRSRFSSDWTTIAPDSAGVMLWATAQRETEPGSVTAAW